MVAAIESLSVSVVLVVRNEEKNILRVLEQIRGQDYPQSRLEVIVVDGQSDDATVHIAREFAGDDTRIKILSVAERGRAQGLNRGIKAATGDVIVRIDARTAIDRDYISRCVETLQRTGADNVGGVQCPIWNSRRQEVFALAQSYPFGVGDAEFRLGRRSGFVDSVYLGCFRKTVFDKVGYFDEQAAVISEDSDFNYRIRQAGGTVYLDKEIKAYYYPRRSFADLWKLFYRYGGARGGNLLKHRKLTSWRQTVPPLFLLALVACAFLSLLDARFASVLWLVLGTYFAVNIVVSLRIMLGKGRLILTPLLVGAFACMHFSYAVGFWNRMLVPQKAGKYWGN